MNYPKPQPTTLVNAQKYHCVPGYSPLNYKITNLQSLREVIDQLRTPLNGHTWPDIFYNTPPIDRLYYEIKHSDSKTVRKIDTNVYIDTSDGSKTFQLSTNSELMFNLIDPKPTIFTLYAKKPSILKNIARFFKLFFTKIIIITLK